MSGSNFLPIESKPGCRSKFIVEAVSKIGFWFNPPEADKCRGGAEFQPGGIHPYFEDLKQVTNKDIGPKNIFEIASKKKPRQFNQ